MGDFPTPCIYEPEKSFKITDINYIKHIQLKQEKQEVKFILQKHADIFDCVQVGVTFFSNRFKNWNVYDRTETCWDSPPRGLGYNDNNFADASKIYAFSPQNGEIEVKLIKCNM